jgi:hypothetical protein
MADAARAGGADRNSYRRWRDGVLRSGASSAAMAPEQVELAVMALARSNPEYVVVGR